MVMSSAKSISAHTAFLPPALRPLRGREAREGGFFSSVAAEAPRGAVLLYGRALRRPRPRFTAAWRGRGAGKMSERGEAPAASAGAGGEMPAKKQKLSSDENSNPGDLSGDENVRRSGGEAGRWGRQWRGGSVRQLCRRGAALSPRA